MEERVEPLTRGGGSKRAEVASQIERLELLLSVAQEITSILDLDRLFERVSTLLQQVIPFRHLAIFLYDASHQELIWKFGLGYSEEATRRLERFPVSWGLVGRAVRTRSTVVSLDVSYEPDFLPAETTTGEHIRSALAVPLVHRDRVVGAMTLEGTRIGEFNEEQAQIVSALGNILAIATVNASLYQASLRDAATKDLLFEVSRELSMILDLQPLLDKIGEMLKQVIDYDLFAIYFLDPLSGDLVLKNTRGWSAESVRRYSRLKKGQGLFWRAIQERRSIVTEDTSLEPGYLRKETVDGRSLAAQINIPLLTKDGPLGVMSLEGSTNFCIHGEHERVLNALAGQIAVAIENAQLYEERLGREKKLESDLQLARQAQLSMLPDRVPSIPGFELGSIYLPADNLGGDFYDFIRLPDGRSGIVIADVSGKGVAAAMTMAASRGAIRSAAEYEDQPNDVLHVANRRLFRDIKRNVYITVCYGVLEPSQGTFTYTSAGHYPPVLIRAGGEVVYLEAGGTILGMFDGIRFGQDTVHLAPGDLICFYTDGIVDAFDANDQPYGETGMEKQLLATRLAPAAEIARRLVGSAQDFARGRAQHDDMTVIVLKSV